MKNQTKNLVMASLLAALTCVATMVIKIPSPLNGYINLGDCVVLLAGWLLNPMYGFLAAGIGSGLADLFSGYASYAPATFLIKGLMALTAHYLFAMLKKGNKTAGRIISGFMAEAVMVGGYLLFESFLYGFVPSLANVLPNCIQGVAGLAIGIVLVNIFDKNNKIVKDLLQNYIEK